MVLGLISVGEVRTPVEGLVDGRVPSAPAILHDPSLSGGVNWVVTEVLSAVTCQGPQILLDFLCFSGGVSQLVLASSGYSWISREFHAVRWWHRIVGVGFFVAGGPCPQGNGSHN